MTIIDTAELERLALSLPAGDWVKLTGMAEATVVPSTQYDAFMSGSLIQGDLRIVHDGDPRDPMCVAIAEAIALVPALIRQVLAHRKAEAGIRALLRAGCDLLAIESEALRNSIRIVGDPDRLSDAPEDAHAVESIREIEDWIASVKATLLPNEFEAEDYAENDEPLACFGGYFNAVLLQPTIGM